MGRRSKMSIDRPEWPVVGNRIRALRLERGLRLGELGRAAGISHAFLSQVEHGRVLPSLSSLFDIAAALKVPAADLLTQKG